MASQGNRVGSASCGVRGRSTVCSARRVRTRGDLTKARSLLVATVSGASRRNDTSRVVSPRRTVSPWRRVARCTRTPPTTTPLAELVSMISSPSRTSIRAWCFDTWGSLSVTSQSSARPIRNLPAPRRAWAPTLAPAATVSVATWPSCDAVRRAAWCNATEDPDTRPELTSSWPGARSIVRPDCWVTRRDRCSAPTTSASAPGPRASALANAPAVVVASAVTCRLTGDPESGWWLMRNFIGCPPGVASVDSPRTHGPAATGPHG